MTSCFVMAWWPSKRSPLGHSTKASIQTAGYLFDAFGLQSRRRRNDGLIGVGADKLRNEFRKIGRNFTITISKAGNALIAAIICVGTLSASASTRAEIDKNYLGHGLFAVIGPKTLPAADVKH